MLLKLLVIDAQPTQYTMDKGSPKEKTVHNLTLLMVDADEGDLPKCKQMFEINLPQDHPPVPRGSVLQILPGSFSEFDGRARIKGEIYSDAPNKKPDVKLATGSATPRA